MNPDQEQKRRALADAIHTYAFAVSGDARRAARVTDTALAQIDRDLIYGSVQPPHGLHVIGNRGDAA